MADVRNVASKAVDNAARLAALFHLYEHGDAGEISAKHIQAAAQIVAWHLYEACRFLGEVATIAPVLSDLVVEVAKVAVAETSRLKWPSSPATSTAFFLG